MSGSNDRGHPVDGSQHTASSPIHVYMPVFVVRRRRQRNQIVVSDLDYRLDILSRYVRDRTRTFHRCSEGTPSVNGCRPCFWVASLHSWRETDCHLRRALFRRTGATLAFFSKRRDGSACGWLGVGLGPQVVKLPAVRVLQRKCHRSPIWSQSRIGIMAPPEDRPNGAS